MRPANTLCNPLFTCHAVETPYTLPPHSTQLTRASPSAKIFVQVFLTGPNFRGIKMMPPGVHFLSFQARSRRDGTLSPPVSTFLHLKPQQVVVRRWDPASEGLVELEEEEVRIFPLNCTQPPDVTVFFMQMFAWVTRHIATQTSNHACVTYTLAHVMHTLAPNPPPPPNMISLVCMRDIMALYGPTHPLGAALSAVH